MAGYVFEELVARITVEGADTVKSEMGKVDDAFDKTTESAGKTADGAGEAGKATKNVGKEAKNAAPEIASAATALLGVVSAATAAVYAVGKLATGLMTVSGVRVAAQFQTAEFGAARLAGSAAAASDTIAELQQMAENSPFRTSAPELMGYARALLATGDNAAQAVKHLKLFQDVAAGTGQDKEMIAGLAEAASKMRSEPEAAIKQLIGLSVHKGVNLQEVLRQGSGGTINARNPEQATEILSSMYGPRAFQIVTKGLEKMFGGAADAAAKGTFNGIVAKMMNNINSLMEPTGRILLPILSAVASTAAGAVNIASAINRFSGGIAGIAAIVVGSIRTWGIFSATLIRARGMIDLLTVSLERMAGVSGVAAGLNGAASIGGIAASAGSSSAKLGTGAAAASMGSRFKAGTAVAAGIVANIAGDAIGGNTGNVISGAGSGLALGGMIAMLPMPPQFKIAAIALGAVAGGINAVYQNMHKDGAAQAETAKNTGEMADSLKELSFVMVGGGSRANRIAGQLQVEYSLQRMLAKSFGGIM